MHSVHLEYYFPKGLWQGRDEAENVYGAIDIQHERP